MAEVAERHARGVRELRRGHDDLLRRGGRWPPSRTATTPPRCIYTAELINPFLVESGLTEEEADLDGLFDPSFTQDYAERRVG